MKNRSVPADTVLPHITYLHLPEAIEWLTRAFGLVEHYRYGDPLSGAQVRIGRAWIMLNAARGPYRSPDQLGFSTQCLSLWIDDLEQHYAGASAAGARIVEPLHETEYGELQYGARDLEGHLWIFARHAHDVAPETWGARIILPLDKITSIS